ncbi:hypothetical protein H7F51_11600 [Novosphingobium flavum]|uniref:Glycosyltransferase RgtA/B/C/D-like domain-containing protein n=1 Tax=Novosphingobium flavum TaxID=1778672 RepID=A0A7X1KM17_9SPHN|nr:hypothetical protein [Novosphingobium flavum]MBC2666162.1 hypothetical protein [Novosphingobium flavum]
MAHKTGSSEGSGQDRRTNGRSVLRRAAESLAAPREPADRRAILIALGIGLVIAALIFARALLTADGYLSPDSMNYLALAANLDRGLGFTVQNEGFFPAHFERFAIWPVGYPLGISLAARLSGLSPFLAAKVLGALMALACTGMVARAGGRTGWVLALPFAFAAALEIFSYSWSEVPFIFFLVCAALLLARIIGERQANTPPRALFLALCSLGLFLSRYVGAFAVALPGLAALIGAIRRDRRAVLVNAALFLASAGFIALYLRSNAAATGYATGMPRIPALDTPWHRLQTLLTALGDAAILPVGGVWDKLPDFAPRLFTSPAGWLALAQLAAFVWLGAIIARRHPRPLRGMRVDGLALSFLTVGTAYLGAIIALRWTNEFDPYNFRLLGPGTLLVTIGLLRAALVSWPGATRQIALLAATAAACSCLVAVWPLLTRPISRYSATVRAVRQHYRAVPGGAIVVFGSDHLHYLRPDLYLAEPLCEPWFDERESWSRFMAEIDHRRPIFVDMTGHALSTGGCLPSVPAALEGRKPGELFRLP